jgi:hypothetical protein
MTGYTAFFNAVPVKGFLDLAHNYLRYLPGGIPEIGYFSLSALATTHRGVRRVRDFRPNKSLLGYASELWTKGLISPQNIGVAKPRTPEISALH